MPEIAEVETVRNVLKEKILHKKIKDVNILYSKIIESDLDEFKNVLIGNEFEDILRKGKWLIFALKAIVKHEHIIISFADGTDLRYHDTRKFGRMKLIKKEDLDKTIEITKQGKEPLDKELTSAYLLSKFKGKRLPIKTVLLDQEIISGLGNIYANEVLFASRINPSKKASLITKEECEKIIASSKKIVEKAILMGGTTIKSYTSSLGVTGHYQDYLCVHKREGMPCPKCERPIKRIKVGGRSTYYCENCQK